MSCTGFEEALARYADGTLPADEQPRVTGHLAGCGECRELLAQFRSLDSALSRELSRPVLSADFDTRLWQRIEREAPVVASAGMVAERKRQLAAEYEADLQKLKPKSSWPAAVLDGLGFGMLAGGIAYAVVRFAPEVLRTSFGSTEALARALAGTLAAAVLVLAVSCAFGWKPGGRQRCSLFGG